MEHISAEFVKIISLSLRLASYELTSKEPADTKADFQNIKVLLNKYESTKNTATRALYLHLTSSILTVPNLYHYDIWKLITEIWQKSDRSLFYPLLASVLPYYPAQLESFSQNNYCNQVLEELLGLLGENQQSNSVVTDPQGHL